MVDGGPDLHPLVAPRHLGSRLLALTQARGVALGAAFLDDTSIRARQKAAGATKKPPLRHNGVLARRLAVLVAAMAPKPV